MGRVGHLWMGSTGRESSGTAENGLEEEEQQTGGRWEEDHGCRSSGHLANPPKKDAARDWGTARGDNHRSRWGSGGDKTLVAHGGVFSSATRWGKSGGAAETPQKTLLGMAIGGGGWGGGGSGTPKPWDGDVHEPCPREEGVGRRCYGEY